MRNARAVKRDRKLCAKGKSTSLRRCKRKKRGYTTLDNHHFAGKANSPATMPVPVNDHRARAERADQYRLAEANARKP